MDDWCCEVIMVGERSGLSWGLENYLCPPPDSTMVDDLSDLSKNKLTVAERVEIVKKIGKELGLEYFVESLPKQAKKLDIDLDENLKDGVEAILRDALESEKDGIVSFIFPPATINVSKSVTMISMQLLGILSSNYSEKYIRRFYDAAVMKKSYSTTFRRNDIDHTVFVPAVSDEYYEQIIHMMIENSVNVMRNLNNLFEAYKELFEDEE